MRFWPICCLLLLTCCSAVLTKELIPSFIVQLVVLFIEKSLQAKETIRIGELSQKFTLENPLVFLGELGFENLEISGLEGLKIDPNNVQYIDDDSSLFFCGNLSISDTLKIYMTNYHADMNILDELPFFGDGDLMISFDNIDFALCFNLTYVEPRKLSNFVLRPGATGLGFKLTGLWKNEPLSVVITDLISSLEGIIMLFWKYNIDCISCIISISIEQIVNDLFSSTSRKTEFLEMVEDVRKSCGTECDWTKSELLRTASRTKTSDLIKIISDKDNVSRFMEQIGNYIERYIQEQSL